MIKCPMCAEEIQDEAKICRFCGCDLISGQRPTNATPDSAPIVVNSGPKENSFQSCTGCVGAAFLGIILLIFLGQLLAGIGKMI